MSSSMSALRAASEALTRYFVGDQTLSESFRQVAEVIASALPQTSHVGVTMLVDGKLTTSVFTDPEVLEIDRVQYHTAGDGPCVDAYRDGVPYIIDSTRQPGRWQDFRDAAERHGVLSTLSLPMLVEGRAIGAVNLYARSEGAYTADDERVGLLFASQAGFLLANAQAYWDARTLGENLREAMASRASIEQARGIIMSTMGCDADAAMEFLIARSRDGHVALRAFATELVRETSQRRA
jgi:GAF domain-containing protein